MKSNDKINSTSKPSNVEEKGSSSCGAESCDCSRREFLFKGLLAAVAVTTSGLGSARAATTPSVAAAPSGCDCGNVSNNLTPALLPNGQLVQVNAGTNAPAHAGLPPSDPAVRRGVPGRKWIMVIDLAKCDGCKNCTRECNKMHHTPSDREWIKVLQMQDAQHTTPYWMPKPCFHCDNPPCTKVCPVDATYKREDGVVLIDNERCIGCRFCMAACPYSTRFFNWGRPADTGSTVEPPYSPESGYPKRKGTVEKCDFCPDMAAQGLLPACVATCGMAAIYYGDQNEDAVTNSKGETVGLAKLLQERAGYRYMEELGTEPRVYYLPPKNRMYPGPKGQIENT